MKKLTFKRKFLFTSISSVAVISLLLICGLLTIAWIALHPEKSGITERPEDYNLTYEDVEFNSIVDDTKLHGWWIPAQGDRFLQIRSKETIIFSHGFGDSRTDMPVKSLKLAQRLTNEGYNVLMFDFRNSGDSEGDMTTIGYYEKYDVLSAIEFAKAKFSSRIGLLGWSMGASSSILAANESDDVHAVIADSPFSDFNNYIGEQLNYWTKLPNKLSPLVVKTTETFMGFNYSKVSPIKAAKEINKGDLEKAMLLIHGKSDNAISYKNSIEIQKKNPSADLWLIEGAGHIRGYKKEKSHYEDRVIEFFNEHIHKKDIQSLYVFSTHFSTARV